MEEPQYSRAAPGDAPAISSLLAQCQLPAEDIAAHLEYFVVARAGTDLIGVIGLEVCGRAGLLRSLAVSPAWRGRGVAKALYERILAQAYLQGVTVLYLLTLTAAAFFARMGFRETDRAGMPESIQSTQEFQTLCPQTSTCMMRQIDSQVRYFPREMLTLKPDIPGATMWGVSLQRTMLTYFEVEPYCRFEAHRHVSEQITLVLKGALYFEMDGETVRVGAGEVNSHPLPSPTCGISLEQAVQAVDAWSPVMDRYAGSSVPEV